MTQIVKICGLSTEESVDAALDAGADMLGFVLFPRSPRHVDPKRAASLADRARNRADIVLLTVNMDVAPLTEAIEAVRPGWLQMHGSETPDMVAMARTTLGVNVIKALPIETAADLARTAAYEAVVTRLMLDAKPPKGADRPGGNGEPFDWTLLREFSPRVPYILSGGLTAQNVGEAIRIANPQGVDVSSGVETAPGRKDPDLIRRFIDAVRKAETAENKAERVA